MLKEAMQYLLEKGNVRTLVAENGKEYSTQPLYWLDKKNSVDPIRIQSLTGIVEYVKSKFDIDVPVMIHVEDPRNVNVYAALDGENRREFYLSSKANLPRINFDCFLNTEEFNIMLQANFIKTTARDNLLKVISSIVEEEGTETKDNGISQRTVAKTGVATRGEVELPNPVELQPFRTFVEVRQPASEFVLRIQKGPRAALFEADGAAWELNAMHNIKEYLSDHLADEIASGQVVIMA